MDTIKTILALLGGVLLGVFLMGGNALAAFGADKGVQVPVAGTCMVASLVNPRPRRWTTLALRSLTARITRHRMQVAETAFHVPPKLPPASSMTAQEAEARLAA
jgi:hypothetical protein